MKTTLKPDINQVEQPGDYAFYQALLNRLPPEGVDILYLCCPFCCDDHAASHTIKINSKDPLDVADNMECPSCEAYFHITNGQAELVQKPKEEPSATTFVP